MNVSRLPRYRAELQGIFSKRCLRHMVFFATASSVLGFLHRLSQVEATGNRYSARGVSLMVLLGPLLSLKSIVGNL
jgi:hypothetical protein